MILSDVCELIVDCPHTTAKDEGEGYALIRTPNIGKGSFLLDGVHRVSKQVYDSRNFRATPRVNDLILAREAPVGNVAIIPEGAEYCLGQRTVLIRPDESLVNPFFLNYYLNSPRIQHELTSGANGATVAHLNMPKIRGLEIVLPARAIQDKVGEILNNYDRLIENCQKRIALLEEVSQRLYKEWFVDYRFPGYESVAIVDGMPEGWSMGVVGDLGKFVRGKNLLTAEAMGGNIPVIAGGLKPSCWHNQSNTKSPVITVSGSGANAGYTAIHNTEVWAADCSFLDASMTSNIYVIYCFLKSNEELLRSKQKGAAQPHVYAKDINACEIIIPTKALLERFHNLATDFFKQIGLLKEMIAKLSTTRNKLLEKLMSGEIEINA